MLASGRHELQGINLGRMTDPEGESAQVLFNKLWRALVCQVFWVLIFKVLMVLSSISHRESLLHSLDDLKRDFQSSLQDAQRASQSFDASCQNFLESVDEILERARNKLPKENPLQSEFSSFIKTTGDISRAWSERIASRDKGVKFRQGFEDSVLVFVNGKVKSGKSSLGNYVAWGHTDPTLEMKNAIAAERWPKYKSHDNSRVKGGDEDGEAEKNREFRVNEVEATSSIQSFTLSGLTWVDSPGLHSLNQMNGSLAEDYRNHADLILYTMKSDAPGRASDLDEILDLTAKNKKIMILLTGSDTTEPDEDEEGNIINSVVMKEVAVQRDQQNYVKEALRNLPSRLHENLERLREKKSLQSQDFSDSDQIKMQRLERIQAQVDDGDIVFCDYDVLSLSARYAQEHAADPEAFRASGMLNFFQQLDETLRSDGVKMKKHVPWQNLYYFLGESKKDINTLRQEVDRFKLSLHSIKKNVTKETEQRRREIQEEVKLMLDEEFRKLKDFRNDQAKADEAIESLKSRVVEKSKKIGIEKLASVFNKISKDFNREVDGAFLGMVGDTPKFKIETVRETVAVGVSAGTRGRNFALGTAIGTGLGAAVGGPFGAAIGGFVGGLFGRSSGRSAQVQTETIELNVGDNLQEIHYSLTDGLCSALNDSLEQQLEKHLDDLESQVSVVLDGVLGRIDGFIDDVDALSSRAIAVLR